MEAAPISFRAYGRLLRTNRNFRLLWMAQIVSEIGAWLYSVAIYSLILELTGSARAVAFAFVLQVLPQCLTSPAAGILNDRLSRRRIMIVSDWRGRSLRCACSWKRALSVKVVATCHSRVSNGLRFRTAEDAGRQPERTLL